MKLPLDRDLARNLVAQTYKEVVVDPIGSPWTAPERDLIQNLATSMLSEGPNELVSPPN